MNILARQPVGSPEVGNAFTKSAFFPLRSLDFSFVSAKLDKEPPYQRRNGGVALRRDHSRPTVGVVV